MFAHSVELISEQGDGVNLPPTGKRDGPIRQLGRYIESFPVRVWAWVAFVVVAIVPIFVAYLASGIQQTSFNALRAPELLFFSALLFTVTIRDMMVSDMPPSVKLAFHATCIPGVLFTGGYYFAVRFTTGPPNANPTLGGLELVNGAAAAGGVVVSLLAQLLLAQAEPSTLGPRQ